MGFLGSTSGTISVEGIFLIDSSLVIVFGAGISDACGAAVVVVEVVEVVVVVAAVVVEILILVVIVVVVSRDLVCFIVECDFALLVVFGLSSVAVVRY